MNDNSTVLLSETATIKGTFDIANARHKLRVQLRNIYHLSTAIYMKISIALTALGELIICMQIDRAISVSLKIADDNGECYFEYACSIPDGLIKNQRCHRYQVNLEKVSSNFEMQKRGANTEITGSVPMGSTMQIQKAR